jgi:hypothetical protein
MAKANQLGKQFTGPLTRGLQAVGLGYRVQFKNCDIYDSAATGAYEVHGAIRDEYNATAHESDYYGHAVQQILGLPTSDVMDVPGVSGARMSTFQGGAIYWSRGTGAHAAYGDIGAEYNRLGGPTSYLGLPTGDEQSYPDGQLISDMRVSYLQNGMIVWSPDGGLHDVKTVSEMTFDWPSITFSDGTPVGGWAELTVYPNGDYHFAGHLHDSGVPNYNYSVIFTLQGISGSLCVLSQTGSVTGHAVSFFGGLIGIKDDSDWDYTSHSDDLAANWADLEGCRWRADATTNWDVGGTIGAIAADAGIVILGVGAGYGVGYVGWLIISGNGEGHFQVGPCSPPQGDQPSSGWEVNYCYKMEF